MNNPKPVHQGKLLKALSLWSGMTQEKIQEVTGITPQWQIELHKKELIGDKNIEIFSSRLGVDKSYFEGKVKLPAKPNIINDPDITYRIRESVLEKEVNDLRVRLVDCQDKVIKLQDEVITLHKEKTGHKDKEKSTTR